MPDASSYAGSGGSDNNECSNVGSDILMLVFIFQRSNNKSII